MTSLADQVTLLLIEDDPEIVDLLRDVLGGRGFRVEHAWNAEQAKEFLAEAARSQGGAVHPLPSLILLDLGLPDEDGLLLCADLKAHVDVPVIICSGTTERRDRILGFKLGADDFIAKPFDGDELVARVEAVLRRTAKNTAPPPTAPATLPEQLRFGSLVIDQFSHEVKLASETLHLTPTEYRLLHTLVSHGGAVSSKEDLAQAVWGHYDAALGRSLDVHLFRLREKLEANGEPSGPRAAPKIVSVRGFGYKIEEPATQQS